MLGEELTEDLSCHLTPETRHRGVHISVTLDTRYHHLSLSYHSSLSLSLDTRWHHLSFKHSRNEMCRVRGAVSITALLQSRIILETLRFQFDFIFLRTFKSSKVRLWSCPGPELYRQIGLYNHTTTPPLQPHILLPKWMYREWYDWKYKILFFLHFICSHLW